MKEINLLTKTYCDNYLQMLSDIFEYADEFLSTNNIPNNKWPVSVRDILVDFGLVVRESNLSDLDHMEMDSYGGFVTLANTVARRVRFGERRGEMGGTILIDHNLTEYGKRFYIVYELLRYLSINKDEMPPIKNLPPARGIFSTYESFLESLLTTLSCAILMPYDLVLQTKRQYEERNSYNPLNYRDWICHLTDLAQIPEAYVILGYEEFRKVQSFRSLSETVQEPSKENKSLSLKKK